MSLDPVIAVTYEDDELLVVNKPADLVCHPTKGDAFSSLVGRVRLYLGPDSHPQFINRLDRETSGLVLLAKTAEAARGLRRLWESREVKKLYLAIVHGWPEQDETLIDLPLGKDEASEVVIKDCVRTDGAPSRTRIRLLRRFARPEGAFSLVEAIPETGRKHQIRIHLAALRHPIVGDKLYGGDERLYLDMVFHRLTDEQRRRLLLPCHALHAGELSFTYRGREWQFTAGPEPWFRAFAGMTEA